MARLLALAPLRALSFAHSVLYAGLLAVWLVPGLHGPTTVLGWSHGIAWIAITLLVLAACKRGTLPWSMLALVSVVGVLLGPFAGSWGFERERRRRLARGPLRASGAVAALLLGGLLFVPGAFALPPDFQDTRFATIPGSSTAMAFLPDGRLLVTTRPGDVHLVDRNGSVAASPALSLGAKVCAASEQGLLGIAVSPAFGSDRAVYLYYTHNKTGTCTGAGTQGAVNRVSRFLMDPTAGTIDPASEQVLVDNVPAYAGNHNAGYLHFDHDGHLFVTVGDGGCYYRNLSRCAGLNPVAQELNSLQGKVLRLTPDGGIPAGNPHVGPGTTRCAKTGFVEAGLECQEIYAHGLRNPFRAGFDDFGTENRFFINDVGQNHWEEVDDGTKGANYGWPMREGPCNTGSYTDCPPPPTGLTDPIHAYRHDTTGGCVSPTGGAFVPPGAWPDSYVGDYLFVDYVCGRMWRKQHPAETGAVSDFASGMYEVVDLAFGPVSTGGRALYVLRGGSTAPQVRRITYVGLGNRAPVASATASPREGQPPLLVQFDGRGSSDADGDPLTYRWDFGDGTTGTGSTTSHQYGRSGVFTARLTVTDARGASDSTEIEISVGSRPVPVIETPAAGDEFAVGRQYVLRGRATDAEDGTLADSRLTWEIDLHHADHFHPFLAPTAGNGVPFTAPAPEDLTATTNTNLRIRLTATDSHGLTATTTRDMDPNRVTVSFATEPTGLRVRVNERTLTGPESVTSWENHALEVDAPTQAKDGQTWVWRSWSDGGARRHVVSTPASDAAYRATFKAETPSRTPPDFNGDGRADVAVGAPDEADGPVAGAGLANVVYGSSSGLTGTGAQQVGQSLANGVTEAGDRFGGAAASGDFNDDGFADLALGAPGEDEGSVADVGFVNVLYGSPSGLVRTGAQQLSQSRAAGLAEQGDRFGAALAAADFDRDGYLDLAVGAPGEDDFGVVDAGIVNVLYGSANGLSPASAQQFNQGQAGGVGEGGDRFGSALTAGNFDGDWQPDLAVGAPDEDVGSTADGGFVNVLYGSSGGLSSSRAQQFGQSAAGGLTEPGDRFGAALAAGDFNGSGQADLAIGAPDEDDGATPDAGFVNALYGGSLGLSGSGARQMTQGFAAGAIEAGDRFGAALAAGDFDASGQADLAVGAPDEDAGSTLDAGIANFLYGSTSGLASARAQQVSQGSLAGATETGDRLGAAVTSADYDGDGAWDVLLGAPDEDVGSVDAAGMVNALYGSASGLSTARARQLSQSQAAGAAEAGDRFGAATR